MSSPGWFSVTFPKSEVKGRIIWRSLEILQDINKHDVCTFSFSSFVPSYSDTLGPGTSVIINYGARDDEAVFIGSVAKIKPAQTIDNAFIHTITCVAASRQFRATSRNTWRNKTGPEVVQSIGKMLGFKVITVQHTLRKKTITQTGGSYWELINDLAKMCGYALRVEGTTIYFLPLSDMLKIFRSGAAQFSYASSDTDTARILEFTASIGDTSDDPDDLADAATVTSFGPEDTNFVDIKEYPVSAIRIGKKYTAPFERSYPDVIAYTREEARSIARGMADRGQMAFDAKLISTGEPLLAPYHPVYIDTGSYESAGWWITKRVQHHIERNEYYCEAVVSTDEVSQQYSQPPRLMPFRDITIESIYGSGSASAMYVDSVGWTSTSPGMSLTPNNGLLTGNDGLDTTSYPSTVLFPATTLYPSV